MTSFSKYFSEIVTENHVTCGKLIHPESSCMQLIWKNIPYVALGSSQFFFPLFFIPLLANPSNVTREKFNEVCKTFVNSVQTAFLTTVTAVWFLCTLYRIRGDFSYSSIIRIPSLLGGWSILLAQDKVRLLFGHTAATLVFEILIHDGSIFPLKFIRNSNFLRMLTFMSVSAFILDTLHVMGGHVFWIIQPSRRPANTNDNNNNNNEVDEKGREICLHKNASCQTYVLQALKSYASIGIGLEIVKALFSNFSLICQDPTVGLMRSVKRINPKFLLFLAGYPTLYRMTNCLLNRYVGESNRMTHAAAAFIGGMPYYFYADELSILTHGFASALELAWTRYLRSLDKSSKQYQYASAIPFSCIVYTFGGAFMYNIRVFYPWLAPKFLFRLIQLLTNHKFDDVSRRIHSYWIPNTMEPSANVL